MRKPVASRFDGGTDTFDLTHGYPCMCARTRTRIEITMSQVRCVSLAVIPLSGQALSRRYPELDPLGS